MICNGYEEGSKKTPIHLAFGRPGLEHSNNRLVDFRRSLGARGFNRSEVTLMDEGVGLLHKALQRIKLNFVFHQQINDSA